MCMSTGCCYNDAMKSSEPCSLISKFLNTKDFYSSDKARPPPYPIIFTWFPPICLCYEALMAKTDEQKSAAPPVCFYSKPAPHCTGESFRKVSLGTGWAFKRAFPAIVASEIPPTDEVLWKNGLPIVSAGNFCLLGGLTNDSIVVLLYRGRIVWSSTTC